MMALHRMVWDMNARTLPKGNPPSAQPRFDRKFIEDNHLVERYLQSKLPPKGARELENWCRDHPEFLTELKLSDRAHNSLKLLEASGAPQDLREPAARWWKTPQALIGLCVVAFVSLFAFLTLFGRYELLRGQLDDARTAINQGSLVQPATASIVHIAPDQHEGIDQARIIVNRSAPQLMDVHVGLSYTKLTQFRMFVDKKAQGRALVLNNLFKDSNDELRVTLNSTGLAAGIYNVRIEGLQFRGPPVPLGWLILEVH